MKWSINSFQSLFCLHVNVLCIQCSHACVKFIYDATFTDSQRSICLFLKFWEKKNRLLTFIGHNRDSVYILFVHRWVDLPDRYFDSDNNWCQVQVMGLNLTLWPVQLIMNQLRIYLLVQQKPSLCVSLPVKYVNTPVGFFFFSFFVFENSYRIANGKLDCRFDDKTQTKKI